MVDFHKLKNLGTDILGRAGEFAEQAKDRVVPLAEQAKDKVGPLAEQAKDKVVPLAGKAKDAAAKGVDKAAEGLDTATGRRFHDKLGDVAGNREKTPTAPAADTTVALDADGSIEDAVIVEDPSTDPDAASDDAPVNNTPNGDVLAADTSATDSPAGDTAFVNDEPAFEDAVAVTVEDAVTVDDAAEAPAADPSAASEADTSPAPELLITTDDGSVHHPTPADMPPHRADDDQS